MTDLMTWLGDNATILAALTALTALAAVAATAIGLANLVIQVQQNRKRSRVSSELMAQIVKVSTEKGLFRQLQLSHANQLEHRFQYHSIRRSGWLWWLRCPCMSHDTATRLVPAKEPSVWRRKLRFNPPYGNIGIEHRTIFVCESMPRPVTLMVVFTRVEETTKLRRHKIRVH